MNWQLLHIQHAEALENLHNKQTFNLSLLNEYSKRDKLLLEGPSDFVLHFKKNELSIRIGAFALKPEDETLGPTSACLRSL